MQVPAECRAVGADSDDGEMALEAGDWDPADRDWDPADRDWAPADRDWAPAAGRHDKRRDLPQKSFSTASYRGRLLRQSFFCWDKDLTGQEETTPSPGWPGRRVPVLR